MRRYFLLLLLLSIGHFLPAQELNARVEVIDTRIANGDPALFKDLQTFMYEFLNSRRWTRDKFDVQERIECNFTLTLTEVDINTNRFVGDLQVTSSRPVYNSEYETPVLTLVDQGVQFNYLRGIQIDFNPDQYNNLTSLLAYYAYLIIGYDYDTFELEGGTPHFQTAQRIVLAAQGGGEPGWRAGDTERNRYWLVENILHQTFRPMRKMLYDYHRQGMDLMADKTIEARSTVLEAMKQLNGVHQIKPLSYNSQVFFLAKRQEIISLFSKATAQEKEEVFALVSKLDPGNISNYEQIKKAK